VSKIPEWAVPGAEIVSDWGGVEIIARVSATSAWTTKTGEPGPNETRWVSAYGDTLDRYGASRWDRSFAYRTDAEPGRRMKWTSLLKAQERKIHRLSEGIGVRKNGFEQLEELTDAAEALRLATTQYLLLIQRVHVEQRLDEEDRQAKKSLDNVVSKGEN
jgi:hypothetical protein